MYKVGLVIDDVLIMPLTVNLPALAVIEPKATIEVLAVIVEVLATPLIVKIPLLAVMEPM